MTNGQLDWLDIISILSFSIGLENLQENREQSAQNDVNKANDKQAQFLLDTINKRLDKQDEMLQQILKEVSKDETH